MNTQQLLTKYRDWLFRSSAYRMALSIIGIDKMTVAPSAGAEYRDQRTAYLAGELFSIENDPEMAEVLKQLMNDPEAEEDDRKAASAYYKEMMKTMCIPKDEYVAFRKLQDESYDAWLQARRQNDYSLFEPYLKKVIETTRKFYGYRESDLSLYDRMLDDFEPGMTTERYDRFFAALKERLLPLIRKVTQAEQIEDGFLYQNYDIDLQKKYTEHILKYLHFDPEWGYQNETEHPFTSWTCENDCRTTTKYLKDNIVSAVLSTVHEVGHATYEHNVDPKYDGMIFSEGISSGMHESQSRLMENYLGRTLAFWQYNYPRLQELFPEQLKDVTAESFWRALNASKPGLLRTEADELTYPVHIMIRYEIEKGLFDGSISTEGLDKVWDQMYEDYLGIKADGAKDGILQDVHWSDGSFGYFPTYALGSAFAAQFVHKMREEIDVDKALSEGRMDICINWLKEKIHRWGCRYSADEVMRIAAGSEFDVNYYLDYLENKYTDLYALKGE